MLNKFKKIFTSLDPEILRLAKKIKQPELIHPMLATLTTNYFSSPDWVYEHKFDGVRCIAFKKNNEVRLVSRNNKLMNTEYPEIVKLIEAQKEDNFIIDGEIAAISKSGISDFQLLQSRINLKELNLIKAKQKTVKIAYFVFDLIYLYQYDIRNLPLYIRKKILKKFLKFNKSLIFSEDLAKDSHSDGIKIFQKSCKLGWEGVIVKNKKSFYIERRSQSWLKFKCHQEQELVIGGYTDPKGERAYFGALLVGYYDKNGLHYAGKIGTGFSQDTLELLGKKLKKLEIKNCPFLNFDQSDQDVHWVKPILVAQFAFAQWTRGGKLRVGRFKGLRTDKKAKEVIKEVPKNILI